MTAARLSAAPNAADLPRPFVGVRTACCGQYARGYVAGGTANGRCPGCGRRFAAPAPNSACAAAGRGR